MPIHVFVNFCLLCTTKYSVVIITLNIDRKTIVSQNAQTVYHKLRPINPSLPLHWSQIIQNGRYNIKIFLYVNDKKEYFQDPIILQTTYLLIQKEEQ